jgi:hypothetical protein
MKITRTQLKQIIKEEIHEQSETRSRFEKEFAQARDDGKETFEFEGESYTTELAAYDEKHGGAPIPPPLTPPNRSAAMGLSRQIKAELANYDKLAEKFLTALGENSEKRIDVPNSYQEGGGPTSISKIVRRPKSESPVAELIQVIIDVMENQGNLENIVRSLDKLWLQAGKINNLNLDWQTAADSLHTEIDRFNKATYDRFTTESEKLSQEEQAQYNSEILLNLGKQFSSGWYEWFFAAASHPQIQEAPSGIARQGLLRGTFAGADGIPGWEPERFVPASNIASIFYMKTETLDQLHVDSIASEIKYLDGRAPTLAPLAPIPGPDPNKTARVWYSVE